MTNNAVVVLNEKGHEQIICGKGIAFKKHAGDVIDETLINQTFVLQPDSELTSQLEQLLTDIPLEYVVLANDIVKMVKVAMSIKISDTLIISLADHIYGVMKRLKDGYGIPNGLTWEIKRFYEKEYEIGILAKEMIEQKLKVVLPIDEAAYIAMHIVNSETENSTIEETLKITKIIQDILKIVRLDYNVEFDEDSGYYYRFIMHLKYFARRILRHEELLNEENNDLAEIVFAKYQRATACMQKIERFLIDSLNYHISKEEKMYITIHIHNAISKGIKKDGEKI
ncbi:MAG: PRD domain-containing protein [Erysipelotrichaceae bacterium]|nr:PRD domain-containing protein [Erysipelotrichaceae bacterium]MDY5252797.1 PRD domain-containing protein [Erysipelotrichaceae bacterium]